MNSRSQLKMTSSTVKFGFLALVLFVLGGCAAATQNKLVAVPPEVMTQYLSDKPEVLKPMYSKVLLEGTRNQVLNLLQAGVAAMELGEYRLAETSFDQALQHIESVYANNAQATQARSLWHEEGAKDYKGEPYERAMAYYYRGILYLLEADYENARACFKSGVIQDAFAEEDQHRCDFALMLVLEGWASQKLGDNSLAEEAFDEVRKYRPDFVFPVAGDSTLVLIETGNSPRKVADGLGHAELKYRRGKNFLEKRAFVGLDEPLQAYPMEDIFFQASTRGGRGIDKILEGQAVFLKRGMKIGTALTEVSSSVVLASTLIQGSGHMAEVGAALGAVGGVVTLVAMNAKPHADTRYWNNLPDVVHVMTLPHSAAESLSVSFTTIDGNEVGLPAKTGKVMTDSRGNQLLWVRSRPALN